MSNELSIAVTILGITAEATAVFLIARYLNSRVPSRWWLFSWMAISAGIAAVLVWAILFVTAEFTAFGERVQSGVDSALTDAVRSQIVEPTSNYVTCLAFSPNGQKLYVGKGYFNPRVCTW